MSVTNVSKEVAAMNCIYRSISKEFNLCARNASKCVFEINATKDVSQLNASEDVPARNSSSKDTAVEIPTEHVSVRNAS